MARNIVTDASKMYLIESYIQTWLKTVGDHFYVEFAHNVIDPFDRMRIRCQECNQTLTCDIPETPEKIDWALQKFVNLHRHDPVADAKLVKEVQDRMNAPKATASTADFKPVKRREGRRFRETN